MHPGMFLTSCNDRTRSFIFFVLILLVNHQSICPILALNQAKGLRLKKRMMKLPTSAFSLHRLKLSSLRSTFYLNPNPRSILYSQLSSSNDGDLSSIEPSNQSSGQSKSMPHNIAIVGGGLAGLSTAYHLLRRTVTSADLPTPSITIFDKTDPGQGGASSVAGG